MSQTLWQIPTSSEVRPSITGRLIGALLGSICVLLLAPVGLGAVAATVALFLAAVGLAITSRRVATQTLALLHLWFGILLELAVSVAVPEIWSVAMVFAAATVTAGVFARPTTESLLLGAGFAAVMALVGYANGSEYWTAMSLVLLATGPVAKSTRSVIDATDNQHQDALTNLARDGQSIIWELLDGKVQTVAGATENITGYKVGEWAKQDHQIMVHPDDLDGYRVLEPGQATGNWQGRTRCKDGAWRYLSETFEQRQTEEGVVMQGQTFDVHKLVEAQQQLTVQAQTDRVTNLPTRAHLITQVQNFAPQTSTGLLTVELVGLREITAAFGQEYSDEALNIVGQRLKRLEPNVIARFAGAEFGLIFKNRSPEQLRDLADTILTTIHEPVRIKSVVLRVEAAVGIATAEDPRSELGELMSNAETALAEARLSPERWQQANPSDQAQKEEKVLLAQQVESAISNGQLELWFQEKVEISTRKITGFEALIRWRHPELDVLSPYRFLDVIELSGHTRAFDRFVITQAIEFADRCHQEGHKIRMSVNLPGRALDDSIVNFIDVTAKTYNIEPRYITLELTEDPTTRKLERIKPVLAALHELGFEISIDDFGTGESTFTRLLDLPVSELKIDRSFVTNLLVNPALETVVRTTVQIAAELNLSCVAEGIEDEETGARLVELGCREGQGYEYSPPVPADEAINKLANQRTASV